MNEAFDDILIKLFGRAIWSLIFAIVFILMGFNVVLWYWISIWVCTTYLIDSLAGVSVLHTEYYTKMKQEDNAPDNRTDVQKQWDKRDKENEEN